MSADLPAFVLASASPRRSGILAMLGLEHVVMAAAVDETRRDGEAPAAYAERLAREKARAVGDERPGCLVLGGDTVVVEGQGVLEKPRDARDAVSMLSRLAGRTHDVLTGMALLSPAGRLESLVARARVTFREASAGEIEAYVATGEPLDKAGAYGIQGYGAALVEGIEGDYYAVVGLSVTGLGRLLEGAGFRYGYPGYVRGPRT